MSRLDALNPPGELPARLRCRHSPQLQPESHPGRCLRSPTETAETTRAICEVGPFLSPSVPMSVGRYCSAHFPDGWWRSTEPGKRLTTCLCSNREIGWTPPSSADFPKAGSRFAMVIGPSVLNKSRHARVSHDVVALPSSCCNHVRKIPNTCIFLTSQTCWGWGTLTSSRYAVKKQCSQQLWPSTGPPMQVQGGRSWGAHTSHLTLPRATLSDTDIAEDSLHARLRSGLITPSLCRLRWGKRKLST